MSEQKSYIVIFKDDADQAAIDEQIAAVEKEGGKITQRYDSSIMRGFAAIMPTTLAESYQASTLGGKHQHIEYIEPDQKISIQPVLDEDKTK